MIIYYIRENVMLIMIQPEVGIARLLLKQSGVKRMCLSIINLLGLGLMEMILL